MEVTIHAHTGIAWHAQRLPDFMDGLRALGYVPAHTTSTRRISAAPAVLFGTTLWREVEAAPGDWLLVDRASVGDPDYVTLGWNGRGRRGDYRVPAGHGPERWAALGRVLEHDRDPDDRHVICGEWDGSHPRVVATHFRPHPVGGNPTCLPTVTDWIDAHYHVLRSSVAVEALIRGYPVTVYDESSMAYGVTDRQAWARWLAWTQWSWQEIRAGASIAHLFRGRHGPI